MPSLREGCAAGEAFLWLDYTEYAQRLLREPVPWLGATEMVAWHRTATSLLSTNVLEIPASAVIAAWLDAKHDLVSAMSAKSRMVSPLRTLLADDGLRAHLSDLCGSLRAAFEGKTLALVLPSPRTWVALAYRRAFPVAEIEVEDDVVESACMYIADFLRIFAGGGPDVVLVEEIGSLGIEEIERYAPLFNVAGHYRWEFGIAVTHTPPTPPQELRPDLWIAPDAVADVLTGVLVPAEFWSGEPAPKQPKQGFRHARIPADSSPEQTLERLALLTATDHQGPRT